MDFEPIWAFWSISRRSVDQSVNGTIYAMCRGLGIDCETLSRGGPEVPAKEIAKLMRRKEGVIAVAVRRKKVPDGFEMPRAVEHEILMARALDKPLLLLLEDGVKAPGLIRSLGTYVKFRRSSLLNDESLQNVLSSLREFQRRVISRRENHSEDREASYHAQDISAFFELKRRPGGFVWSQEITKHLIFDKRPNAPLVARVWPSTETAITADEAPLSFRVHNVTGSKRFSVHKRIRHISPSELWAELRITPTPVKGDFIRYTASARSRWLNPVYREDVFRSSRLELGGRRYLAFDGVIPVQKTTHLGVVFRAPTDYGIREGDIVVFAGQHTTGINFIDDEETNRIEAKTRVLGDILEVSFEVKRPLVNHLYGVAWNPPARPRRRRLGK